MFLFFCFFMCQSWSTGIVIGEIRLGLQGIRIRVESWSPETWSVMLRKRRIKLIYDSIPKIYLPMLDHIWARPLVSCTHSYTRYVAAWNRILLRISGPVSRDLFLLKLKGCDCLGTIGRHREMFENTLNVLTVWVTWRFILILHSLPIYNFLKNEWEKICRYIKHISSIIHVSSLSLLIDCLVGSCCVAACQRLLVFYYWNLNVNTSV